MKVKINESEYRFMDILWEKEPVSSPELVKLCAERLGWKKSTTYTVIKNLSEKQALVNQNTIVTSLVSWGEVNRQEAEEMLEKKFGGNIPVFLAAFMQDRKLTREEAMKIRKMIDEMSEEEI